MGFIQVFTTRQHPNTTRLFTTKPSHTRFTTKPFTTPRNITKPFTTKSYTQRLSTPRLFTQHTKSSIPKWSSTNPTIMFLPRNQKHILLSSSELSIIFLRALLTQFGG